jgi:hypothetical protein
MSDHRPMQIPETLFVNEMRLGARQWACVGALVLLVVCLTPPLWGKLERFDTGPDFRIPYALSKDYWLYARRLRQAAGPGQVLVLGDSVVWGEYVLPDGTLSHFLNRETGQADRFVNAGVNGLFPLALEGLVRHYGGALHDRKVILHCNVLWLTSPKADLQTRKEEKFNHARLVAQFVQPPPCYRADANERISALVERNIGFISWVGHLQNAYFGQKSILNWTLEDDGGEPAKYPNSYRNPLAQIALTVPPAPREDPQRGPASARHKPWNAGGAGPTAFEWVTLESSLQWAAFQRVVGLLRARHNDVLVVFGPFNEHMVAAGDRRAFQELKDGMLAWLKAQPVPVLAPEPLPSELYADASHPLTDGYALLAKGISRNEEFQRWLKR